MITEEDRKIARAEAESIAKRWVPAHMTARQGLVDNIVASLLNARELERDKAARVRPPRLRDYVGGAAALALLFGWCIAAGWAEELAWTVRHG